MDGTVAIVARSPAEAARAWRAGLPAELRRRSDLRGGLVFAANATLYLLSFLGLFLLPTWWLQLLALAGNPVFIGALFVTGHDACHGALVRTGRLNRVLGRVAMLPAWHPFAGWAHTHNTMHHGWTNFKGRQPDFSPFTKAEFDALPRWRRRLERVYRHPLGIGLYYTLDFYARHLLLPTADRRTPHRRAFELDRLLIGCFFIAQVAAAWLLARLNPDPVLPRAVHATAAVVLPWTLWVWFMGFVSFIQHTHPRLPWYDDEADWSFYHVQMTSTVHVVFPWPVERLLQNIMDHPAHHLDPTIPLYHLPESQRRLERDCPEHAAVVRWTPWEYLRTCAACKLYDFESHRWLNFAGEPTTPPQLPPRR